MWRWPRPAVAVDLVVLTVLDADLKVLLIRRGEAPFAGSWALPGGFVRVTDDGDQGEDLDDAAHRELAEETGLPPRTTFLEQVRTFGRPGRDPRLRVISVVYAALVPPDRAPLVRAGTDAAEARFFSVRSELPGLAFDHRDLLDAGVAWVADRLGRTDLGFELVPPTFTIPELRAAHEAVTGQPLDPGNFRRGFQRLVEDGVVEPAPGRRITGARPASVFRFVRRGPTTG